ncbi:MAG: arylsulfatase [Pirellulales bacterium]
MSWLAGPAAAGPNVVYILADDLGLAEVGPFGQRLIPTPRLDQMAGEGLCFDRAYAGSAVCAPSRVALLTGMHTGRGPIRANKEYPNGQHPMPPGIPTVAKSLKAAGYATGCFGKWGGGYPGSGSEPLDQGFDCFVGYNHQIHAQDYFPQALDEGRGQRNLPLRNGEYSHGRIMYEALLWIRDQAGRKTPFFLFLPVTLPHGRLQSTPEMLEPFKDSYFDNPAPDKARLYAAMVHRLDADVGRILDVLRELGIAQDTLVVFLSDNGCSTAPGYHPEYFRSRGGLRGDKRSPFEGGFRTAEIAWWPGTIAAGRRTDHLTAAWDLFPTACELAGVAIPGGLSGISLVPTLTGKGLQRYHEMLFFELHEGETWQAVVWPDHTKAIRRHILSEKPDPIEIYDLAADPAEERNLSADRPDLVRRAEAAFRDEHVPNLDFPLPGEPGWADRHPRPQGRRNQTTPEEP